jgi:hypothetical protein
MAAYEYYNQVLCVNVNELIEKQIFSFSHYKQLVHRSFLNVIRRGGNGRTALVEFSSIKREDIKGKIIQMFGDPKETAQKTIFESYLKPDTDAAAYFSSFRKSNGKALTFEKQKEYVTNAIILNAIDTVLINNLSNKRRLTGNKTRIWENISNAINQLPSKQYTHSIPGNYRSVKRVYEKFKAEGFTSLVHGGLENDNRRKISGDIADFLLANYCLPTKPLVPTVLAMYDSVRIDKGWPTLSESAVQLYLDQPEIKRLWVLARHGKDEYSKSFGHKIKRDRADWFPNAYWAIDGTKLDWVHYLDVVTGMAAKLKINPVFDVFSEKIIGYSLSESEDHTDHFTALKSAMNTAQSRPYKLTYDNQSGHKSARMQELYDSIIAKEGGVHHPTRAYAKSNPAEQIFNRLQQQVISTFWFSDKQGVRVRDMNNVMNVDFLKANKHLLLSKDELVRAWEMAVKMWNEAKHPLLECTRNEAYAQQAPLSESVDYMDLVNMFWVNETKSITYEGDGLTMKIAGQRYMFEVLDENSAIDLEFRKFNTGKKFIVRYDPEHLDKYVQLLELDAQGNKSFVALAEPKRAHQEIPVLMKEGDKSKWQKDFEVRDLEYQRDLSEIEALRQRTGITPEKLIQDQNLSIKMGGKLPKVLRTEVESEEINIYDLMK